MGYSGFAWSPQFTANRRKKPLRGTAAIYPHDDTDLSTSYWRQFNSFPQPSPRQTAIVGAMGAAPKVANPNLTPDCQKFVMIRSILKFA
jgi:hypothetical protein